jgi:hypothetical protein
VQQEGSFFLLSLLGGVAADEAGRPSYPPAAVEGLLDALRIDAKTASTVVDVGAGTGKASLAARMDL